jgi:anthranilate phosphoribosyltransferase
MTNPAGANRQLIGVYDKTLVETIAGVLADLGSERAFVVHGSDGLDEITTTGETFAAEVKDGKVRTFTISPADYSIKPAAQDELIGGDAETNAAIFTSILAGEKGPKRDIVLLNSAYAICAGGRAETPEEGFGLAEKSIDSGEARGKYEALKELSNS